MTHSSITLSQVCLAGIVADWRQMSALRQQVIVGLVILGILAFAAVLWALFIHTPSERRRARGQARRESEPQHHQHRRKWKKRRREHRPRNPTLAETGGLPPPREHPPVGPIP